MLSRSRFSRRNQDIVLDSLIFRHNNRHATFVQKPAHQTIGATLKHLDNGAVWLATIVTGYFDETPDRRAVP
jgi:hypothetical protein